MNTLQERRLSLAMIESSSQIRAWLDQFQGVERDVAIDLLLHLRFVTRDGFSEWVRNTILNISSDKIALYAVRKFKDNCLWNSIGKMVGRPGTALGSEDLVYSLIRQLDREFHRCFDNPDLDTLRKHRIRDIVLLDDSIGSGGRLSDFARKMFDHPTFMSWWSYGLIRLHVVSYARTREGEGKIISHIPGSNHARRKFPKSTKLNFYSKIVYSIRHFETRWGNRFDDLLKTCNAKAQIPKKYRRGYGEVMGNIVFYHSIPNNIPGMLFWSNEQGSWKPLFPARTIPDWMVELLESRLALLQTELSSDSKQKLCLLVSLARKGVRRRASLALRMDLDIRHVYELIKQAASLGFIDGKLRPTKVGIDFVKKNMRMDTMPRYDYSLYVPGSWCAGRRTIQPFSSGLNNNPGKADSAAAMLADGEVGKASLARTDATAATPPMVVTPQQPSESRKGRDDHDPRGLKEE